MTRQEIERLAILETKMDTLQADANTIKRDLAALKNQQVVMNFLRGFVSWVVPIIALVVAIVGPGR